MGGILAESRDLAGFLGIRGFLARAMNPGLGPAAGPAGPAGPDRGKGGAGPGQIRASGRPGGRLRSGLEPRIPGLGRVSRPPGGDRGNPESGPGRGPREGGGSYRPLLNSRSGILVRWRSGGLRHFRKNTNSTLKSAKFRLFLVKFRVLAGLAGIRPNGRI